MNVPIPELENELCRGCASYILKPLDALNHGDASRFRICGYTVHNEDGMCPCTECVVKVMCVDPCDDYSFFENSIDSIGM